MRTTINVSDELLATARERARATGRSLGQVVDDALRRDFALHDGEQARPTVPVFHGQGGPRAGLDLTSNAALYEALDEGHGLDRLR